MTSDQLRPRPAAEFAVQPTAEDVQFFADNGFLVVDRITTDEEIDWLAELYEHIFDPANGERPGAPIARDKEPGGGPLVRQAFMPEFFYPELMHTAFNRNARIYAAALLQVDIADVSCWGHMIRKAPGGRAAPWHQDEAFWETELEYHALGAWLPLHDVTEEMGCMQFVRGSHRHGIYEHRPVGDDIALHILAAQVTPDPADIVSCPLKKGGATFHHQRTLHYTAPNQTDRPRLAFPTEFQVAPRRRTRPAVRPWVDDWRAVAGPPTLDRYPADGRMADILG